MRRRIAQTRQLPLYRSSYALILTTVGNAVLGLLFWIAAARLYPARIVGAGAGAISALQLVAAVGWVGLQFTLMRYVPVAGFHRRRLIACVYAVGAGAALVLAVCFVLALATTLKVGFVSRTTVGAVVFCASTAVWVVFSLQDAVLVGIRRAFLVPLENAVYGLLKLALLIVLASIHDPWTFLGVWVGAAGALVVVVNGLLFSRLLKASAASATLPTRSRLTRFSAGHTAVALTSWTPDFLVPLLVLHYRGDAANAYYYAAWTIGFSARLLAVNMANALTVEGAYAEQPLRHLVRSAVRLAAAVLVPVIAVLLAGAELLLRVFGGAYATQAAPCLRYFALSLLPFAVVAFVAAFDRVRERYGLALTLTAVGSVTALGLDFVLIPALGIGGAGLAWLIGQAAAAALAAVTMLRQPTSRPASAESVPEETPVI